MVNVFKQYYLKDSLAWLNGLKTLIAISIGLFIIVIFQAPHSSWILISTILVMTFHMSYGFQLERAIARIVGTVVGALVGILVIQLPHQWLLMLVMSILVAAVFLSVSIIKPRWRYIVVLGMITYMVVVIQLHPSIGIALQRAGEILLGILIALGVGFIRPIKSSSIVENLTQSNWLVLYQWASLIVNEHRHRHEDVEVTGLEGKLRDNFSKQRELLLGLDMRHKTQEQDAYIKTMRYQSGIFRYLIIIEIVQREFVEHEGESIFEWGPVGEKLLACLKAVSDNTELQHPLNELNLALHTLEERSQQHSVAKDAIATVRFSMTRIAYLLSLH